MKVKPIPEGYHAITPYLVVNNAAKAIDFYRAAFGAKEKFRIPAPGGKIGHAEIEVGNSVVMLADEHPDHGFKGPQSYGGTPVSLLFYTTDVDGVVKKAISAGAEVMKPVEDQFYGDRMGTLRDPFGHIWSVATHVEDVSPEEMNRRMAKMGQK